jgi:hypothetical protein
VRGGHDGVVVLDLGHRGCQGVVFGEFEVVFGDQEGDLGLEVDLVFFIWQTKSLLFPLHLRINLEFIPLKKTISLHFDLFLNSTDPAKPWLLPTSII